MQVNNRQEERRKKTGTYSMCWPDSAGQIKSAEVHARDISKSGLGIVSSVEVPTGTTVYIEAKDGHAHGYCAVRHCAEDGENFRIGLEYDEETKTRLEVGKANGAHFDYYEFLQISPKAEFSTIQRIYRFMAGRFHPDNPATGDPEKFLLLKQAYEVLSDPQRRAEYDAGRETQDARPNPIFEMSEFVNGVEGEVNRRLGVLSLLYNQRRTNSENPSISLYDIEKRMGWPREYLDFTTWYLRNMRYITSADNSDFSLTALGVDYVESNYTKIPILNKLLNSGTRTATSSTGSTNDNRAKNSKELLLMPAAKSTYSNGNGNGAQAGAPGSERKNGTDYSEAHS